MNPYEDSIVKSLREEVSSLQSELSAAVDSYQSNVSALARKEEEVKRLREVLNEDRGEFYLSLRADRDAWKQKAEALAEALELIICSNATEGTLTFSKFPLWFQVRMNEAKAALAAYREPK